MGKTEQWTPFRPDFPMKRANHDKLRYQELRTCSWNELWNEEVPRFNQADATERRENLALIRAVGVVFSESGPANLTTEVKQWLRQLLQDPEEKIRRYAMNALPKIGAETEDEARLLSLLQTTGLDLEKRHLGKALDKIGTAATLESLQKIGELTPHTEQKMRAGIARAQQPGTIRRDAELSDFADLRIHLRTRRGLETILRDEFAASVRLKEKFQFAGQSMGLVTLKPIAAFSLSDLYSLRCFGTLGLVIKTFGSKPSTDTLARAIAAPLTQRVLQTFTAGPIRYRLEFMEKGHQRGAIREIVAQAYSLCPQILNDPREALWAAEVHPHASGESLEFRPRLSPDPRFAYRIQDVPAASHPPLAAAMARLAGTFKNETVWDPFCGSGLELIECGLRGGVRGLYGTDRSAEAIAITETNLAAAGLTAIPAQLVRTDFRDYTKVPGLNSESISLIVSNPPMGKRVQIHDLTGLIEELLAVASRVLKPGGRLIFPNPVPIRSLPAGLKLLSRQKIDMSGFDCQLEVYQKSSRPADTDRFAVFQRRK